MVVELEVHHLQHRNSTSKEMTCRRIRQGCIISLVPFNQSQGKASVFGGMAAGAQGKAVFLTMSAVSTLMPISRVCW